MNHLYLLTASLRRLTLFGAALCLLLVVPMLAQAADGSTVNLGGLWDSIQPFVASVAEGAIAAVIGWVALRVHKWTGINIEARHREALHSAAITGVNLALSRARELAALTKVDARTAVVAEAYSWVTRSVPDALLYLGVTPEKTRDLLEAKLNDILGIDRGASIATIESIKADILGLPELKPPSVHDIGSIRGLSDRLDDFQKAVAER